MEMRELPDLKSLALYDCRKIRSFCEHRPQIAGTHQLHVRLIQAGPTHHQCPLICLCVPFMQFISVTNCGYHGRNTASHLAQHHASSVRGLVLDWLGEHTPSTAFIPLPLPLLRSAKPASSSLLHRIFNCVLHFLHGVPRASSGSPAGYLPISSGAESAVELGYEVIDVPASPSAVSVASEAENSSDPHSTSPLPTATSLSVSAASSALPYQARDERKLSSFLPAPDAGPPLYSPFQRLQFLCLRSSPMAHDLKALTALPALRFLFLGGSRCDGTLLSVLDQCPALQAVDLTFHSEAVIDAVRARALTPAHLLHLPCESKTSSPKLQSTKVRYQHGDSASDIKSSGSVQADTKSESTHIHPHVVTICVCGRRLHSDQDITAAQRACCPMHQCSIADQPCVAPRYQVWDFCDLTLQTYMAIAEAPARTRALWSAAVSGTAYNPDGRAAARSLPWPDPETSLYDALKNPSPTAPEQCPHRHTGIGATARSITAVLRSEDQIDPAGSDGLRMVIAGALNCQDAWGRTPLHYAVLAGNTDCARYGFIINVLNIMNVWCTRLSCAVY